MQNRRFIIAIAAPLLAVSALCAVGGSAAAATSAAARPAAADTAAAITPAVTPAGAPALGPDVYIFTPSMPQSQIQSTVNAIASQQVSNQFGTQRYALLFEPGTYGSAADPLTFQVGYYTAVAGLGAEPGDVTINGSINVYNQCFLADDCIALDNFWRSMSNLTINITGQTGCEAGADFWAVSQAAPMRRVDITGGNLSLMDYCNGAPDYASGGFIADSAFSGGTVINGSQQQFLVRNSTLDGWSNGVWNQVFSGDPGAPAQSFSPTSGDSGGTAPYTTLAASPETQEEPFLQDKSGTFSVFVPALRHNSVGPAWSPGTEAGTTVPLNQFFIAGPSTPVGAINAALAAGLNLILTPGVYSLYEPLLITRPGTIVLGLGFPTLVPQFGQAAMQVATPLGVKLSGLIFDAGPRNSPVLLQVGAPGTGIFSDPGDPALVQDVFFRIGGATAGSATEALEVNSSDVILDDIWAWRADHGTGVGWTSNTSATGVTVNGSNVTAYGLAVEHFQKNEVVWAGQHGTDIFYQNEMPYDPPSQAPWMSGPATDGYPSFVVEPGVTSFSGYGMGSYSFFEEGVPIESATAFLVPTTPGVQLHDLLTVFLSGSGGIESVVDGTGAAVSAANGGPSDVVSYP